ncbi:sigma-70 family RNA polymerase sigma factor [bacterium]|nr:sigma-70 family RNA polymerase sigma factor [bacterium]
MTDSFKQYLNEIGRYPLLTAEQEIQLSRQINAAKPLLGKEDPTVEEKRILRVGERATRKLINCNLRLVVTVAKQYTRRLNGNGMELMDLVQEGALGLTRAVELFDGTKGYKFSTYAYWWVRQAITRGIDTKERLIRVPQHGLDKVYKVVRYQKEYVQLHGKYPTLEVLAEATDIDVNHLQLLLARNAWHRSLDELVADTGNSILDMISDAEATDRQIDCMERDEKEAMLGIALDCLSQEELHTISRRYGLETAEPMTLSSIAKEDGVSRECVRQRVQVAHNKMRLKLRHARFA